MIIESLLHDFKGELRDLKIILEDNQKLESPILFQLGMMDEMLLGLEDFYSLCEKELKKETFDFFPICHCCFEKVKERSPSRNINFEINVKDSSKNASSLFHGDSELIMKAMSFLFENSFKFTKNESKALIRLGEEKVNGKNTFYLYNNGPSLLNDVDIFKLFYGKRSHHEDAGLGLGLPFSKVIFEKHGGDLWAKNLDKGGVKFYFRF